MHTFIPPARSRGQQRRDVIRVSESHHSGADHGAFDSYCHNSRECDKALSLLYSGETGDR